MPATAPLRAAIYARYSTDKQKETSVEDQFRLCRRHCDQKGWQVTQVFADHGTTSAARQYSGRAVGDDWRCPFSGRKDTNPDQ